MNPKPSFLMVHPSSGMLSPLGIDQVTINGGFWGERQDINGDVTIPHCLFWENKVGWIDNFRKVLDGSIIGRRTGREFSDSDVYKLIEAMAWEAARTGDDELEAEIERLGSVVEAIQCDDGYVNTKFGSPGQAARYSDFAWGHELYCFGHLFQAAVARLRTGRDGAIVRVALKAADHVCREFAEGARRDVCGHPEVEVALAELGRATGEDRYLEQARIFLERRGRQTLPDIEYGRSYYQDDVPFREADVLRGHSVRALYLCAAAVDVAVERGDEELLAAARRQYDAALARRTYLTGGMGSHHQDEAFGDDFELPPDRSYCETCAGIGSIMVAWRLLLATGDMSYGDVIERSLYNVVAASMSEAGNAFFYANTLHKRTPATPASPDEAVPRANSSLRAPWFEVSCCPTNVARTLASLGGILATTHEDRVQIHQYIPATIRAAVPAGSVELRMDTDYPVDGTVTILVVAAPGTIGLDLRIPRWAEGATVNGDQATPGVHRIQGLSVGSTIELVLPMHPRVILPDRRIDAVRGTVAVERGPRVLCLESVDLPDGLDVHEIAVAADPRPRVKGEGAVVAGVRVRHSSQEWPYGNNHPALELEDEDIVLVPYHGWANRGPSTMRVWLPTLR